MSNTDKLLLATEQRDPKFETAYEPFTISFRNSTGKVLGVLGLAEDKLKFEGEADESAKLFFKFVCDMWDARNNSTHLFGVPVTVELEEEQP